MTYVFILPVVPLTVQTALKYPGTGMSSIVFRPGVDFTIERNAFTVMAQVATSPFTLPEMVDWMFGSPEI